MENEQAATPEKAPKLLDQLRDRLRLKRYSIRTETQYVQWARRYIIFHDKRHPKDGRLGGGAGAGTAFQPKASVNRASPPPSG